ncbi:MAG: CSLREA domain-containing protein, partial [Anaerolineae bacterium]
MKLKNPLPLILIGLAFAAITLFGPVPAAWADTITVNTANDVVNALDGQCSLREAVIAANTNTVSGIVVGECPSGDDNLTDTIFLSAGEIYQLAIPGGGEDAAASGDLDFVDNAAAVDVRLATSGGGMATIQSSVADRVLHILGATVETAGVVVRDGNGVTNGAGIYNAEGHLTLITSTVTLNTSNFGGGGIYNSGQDAVLILDDSGVIRNFANTSGGAGIANAGGLAWVRNGSLILSNQVTDGHGGGIYNIFGRVVVEGNSQIAENQTETAAQDGKGGGIFNATGTLTVTNSTVSGNDAELGGGIFVESLTVATISDSALEANTASQEGGGLYNAGTTILNRSAVISNMATLPGGGIWTDAGLTLVNSTVSGNQAGATAAGIYVETTGQITATNATIAANSGPGWGIYKAGEATLQNTIVADHANGNCLAVATPFNSL